MLPSLETLVLQSPSCSSRLPTSLLAESIHQERVLQELVSQLLFLEMSSQVRFDYRR